MYNKKVQRLWLHRHDAPNANCYAATEQMGAGSHTAKQRAVLVQHDPRA